jgi:hypothetical protein
VHRLVAPFKHPVGVKPAQPAFHVLPQRVLIETRAAVRLHDDPHDEVGLVDLEVERASHPLMPLKLLPGGHEQKPNPGLPAGRASASRDWSHPNASHRPKTTAEIRSPRKASAYICTHSLLMETFVK